MSRLSYDDFSGGLWVPDESAPTTEQAGFSLPRNGLLQADHLDYLPSGAVRGRRGSSKFNAAPLPGAVRVMRRFYARESATSRAGQVIGFAFDDPANYPLNVQAWTNPFGVNVFDTINAAQVQGVGGVVSAFVAGLGPFALNPVPAGATINGIEVRVIRRKEPAAGTVTDNIVRLVKAGAIVTGGAGRAAGTNWSRAFEVPAAYGGPTDLWDTTLTVDEVNSPGFGVAFAVSFAAAAQIAFLAWIEIRCHYTASVGDQFLVGYVSGANLQYATGSAGTFSAVSGGSVANPSRRPWLVPWPQLNRIFIFDGENEPRYYDGDAISILTAEEVAAGTGLFQTISPRKGPYACLHKNRLVATDPSELQSSVYFTDVNSPSRWRPELQLACNDDRGGKMTGLASFGDTLCMFKNTAVFTFVGDPELGGQLTEMSPEGCIAPDTIQSTPFGVLYLGRKGLWLSDGSQVVPISNQLRSLFVERTTEHTYATAVGTYYPRRDQYWLHLNPGVDENGYILHRVMIPTETGEEQRLAWSRVPGLPFNCGTVWAGGADSGELYVGDLDGFVWLRDTGSDDDGVAYTTTLRTRQALLNQERIEGRIYSLRPIYRGAQLLTGALRYDQNLVDDVAVSLGVAASPPTIQEPALYISQSSSFGRFVSVRVESSEGPEFELHRIDADVRRRGSRVWR